MRAVSEFDRNGEVSAKTEAEIKKSIKSFYSQWEKVTNIYRCTYTYRTFRTNKYW